MILVAYLEIFKSLSTPSRFARYDSRWFKKSLSLIVDLIGFLGFCDGEEEEDESFEASGFQLILFS